MDMLKMQADALDRRNARSDAIRVYHAGHPYADNAARKAAWSLVPYPRSRFGNIECEAIIPENRTTLRRRHIRFIWWISGKRASADEVAALLDTLRAAA